MFTCGTIVALEEVKTSVVMVGLIHLPHFEQTVVAASGYSCWCDGERSRVSAGAELSRALVSAPYRVEFKRHTSTTRSNGCGICATISDGYTDCWAHVKVATGALDALIEHCLSPWDLRATRTSIDESGETLYASFGR